MLLPDNFLYKRRYFTTIIPTQYLGLSIVVMTNTWPAGDRVTHETILIYPHECL